MKDPVNTATEKSIEEAAKTARHMLDKFGAPAEELGLLIKDRISFWRFKQQVSLVMRAKEIIEEKGVGIDQLPPQASPGTMIEILERGSFSDDPTIQEMFANLLASELESGAESIHPSFSIILSQLSSEDAKMLTGLYRYIRDLRERPEPSEPWPRPMFENILAKNQFYTSKGNAFASIENLQRLGLIYSHPHPAFNTLSKLGWSFILAATGDDPMVNRSEVKLTNPFKKEEDSE